MRRFIDFSLFLLLAVLVSLPALAQQDVISTVIGGGPSDMPALDANLNQPVEVAADGAGNYYISAFSQNRVFKVDSKGILTVYAGLGIPGYAGDGVVGGATQALLNGPHGISFDAAGNLYIAEYNNCVIRKVDTAGTITTIAGQFNQCTYNGDGKPATNFDVNRPVGVAVDAAGNLFIGDSNNCRVRKLVLASKTISTFAGNGTCDFLGDKGKANIAEVNVPYGVAVDTAGNVYISDNGNAVIREVTKADGKINTIAGTPRSHGFGGDGGPATSALLGTVVHLTVNGAGTKVTFPDQNNQRIRQFTVGGNINTVAGTGSGCFGPCGDGGPAINAQFDSPQGIAALGSAFLIADTGNDRVRSFTVGGNIDGVAGNGSTTQPTLLDGIDPSGVVLNNPWGVLVDPSGNIFFGDTSNQMVRELVKSTNLVDFFAGNGIEGFTGDGGPATKAELNNPRMVARDSTGNIYIADESNQVIRKVNTAGKISTFAGTPLRGGFGGDGGPATSAFLNNPQGVFVDSHDNVYIADQSNHLVRKVTNGTISTIAGLPGHCAYAGDGGLATNASLCNPQGVAVDAVGNVFIADTSNCRIREVSAFTGILTTLAGNACGFNGDGQATQAELNSPGGVAVDANDNVFIADTGNQLIRWVDASGNLTTIAGNRNCGYNGDGSLATSAALCNPSGITVDASGNYLIADQSNFRVRGVSAFAALNVSNSNLSFPLTSVGSTSNPQIVTLTALGPLTLANIQISGDFSEADNCPSSLSNGQSCTMYVYFSPTASGTRVGAVTISDNGFFNSQSIINLTGIGTAITLGGSPVNFGNQLVNTTSGTQNVTVTNNGSTGITMGAITLNETTDFTIKTNNCPASGKTLGAGASCTLGLTFNPKSTGFKKGAVIINDSDPTSPQIAGVSGTGTSNVQLAPASVDFGSVQVGITSGVTNITLTNKTGGQITLGTPALTVTGDFLVSVSKTTCTNGLKVANNGSCIVAVQFKPKAVGFRSGQVSVADNDPTSPQTAALSGTGVAIGFKPASVNFGSVSIGQRPCDTVTISNAGTNTVTFLASDIVGPNSSDFAEFNSTCAATIAPGANCNIQVCFGPNKKGKESATYELFDTSPGSPQKLPMTGTGQ